MDPWWKNPGMNEPLSRYLDAAVLKPELTRSEAGAAIHDCVRFHARTACVRPCDIVSAKRICQGTGTGVCVVLAFPHGTALPESKAEEARRYLSLGADEIDMVANYGLARSGLWDDLRADIAAVTCLTRPAGVPLKVIFETSQHDLPTIRRMVDICIEAGADFVKTSTGFHGEGATDEVVRTMLEAADGRIKVKPSGGIRDRARAEALLAMGAHRLGVGWTSCEAICAGGPAASGSY
jgi:deoxyribose-phosphate aldolase